jgi:hypothetical protein
MIIVLTLVVTSNNRLTDLHKFKNFAEDVFGWLRDNGWGEVDFHEIDGPSGMFAIRGVKSSKSRRVVDWVEQEAKRQHVTISLEVQRDGGP